MDQTYRIIDANLNRAREALRVSEEYARFILEDGRISSVAKNLRSQLQQAAERFDSKLLLNARDTAGDVGTNITSQTENSRASAMSVANASCKRLTEALRAIEEYSKISDPQTASLFEKIRYQSYEFEQLLISRSTLIEKYRQVKLYMLLSSKLCKLDPIVTAHEAIAGGVDCIQLREKQMASGKFLALAKQLRAITKDAGILFIVNDRPDIAALSGADGVHIGQDDLSVSQARKIIGGEKLIGVSTHNVDQMIQAAQSGADYIGVGPMFETATKSAEPAQGPKLLKQAVELEPQLKIPHIQIGGINAENVLLLKEIGAKAVAVCGAIISNDSPKSAAEKLKQSLL